VPKRFYEQALTEAESTDLESARAIEGLDDEVALLRLRLRSLLAGRPEDLTLMFKGVELLTKAVSARYRMSKGERSEVSESLRELITSMQGADEEVADV
jgi:hypothetical protein